MSASVNETLAQQITAATPDAVIFADRDGVVRLWNAGAENMFGYSAAEALGQTLDLIIPERLRPRHWEGYRRVMETGVSRYSGSDLLAVPAVRKDGVRISLEFSIALVCDSEGRVVGAGAILRDVTKRWREEKALKERLATLEAKAR